MNLDQIVNDEISSTIISKKQVIIIVFAFILILLVKVLLSFNFISPQVFADEYVYDLNAQIIASGELFFGKVPLNEGPFPPGYSFLVSIAYFFSHDKYSIYHISLILNCIISTVIIFPGFLLLRRYCSSLEAVLGAILVTVIPSVFAPSFLLMSENLLVPLFILSIWLINKFFSSFQITKWDFLLGIILSLIFFTRTPGISMILAIFCVFILWVLSNQEVLPKNQIYKKIFAVLIPIGSVYGLWIMDQLLAKGYLPSGYSISSYYPALIHSLTEKPLNIISSIIIHGDYLLIASWIVLSFFALMALYFLLGVNRGLQIPWAEQKYEPRFEVSREWYYGTIYTIISSIGLFAFTILHMNDYVYGNLCGRYVDPLVPVIIIFGVIGVKIVYQRVNINKWTAYAFLLFLIFSYVLISIVTFPRNPEPNNNPAVFYLYVLGQSPLIMLVGVIPLVLFLFIYYAKNSHNGLSFLLVSLILLSVVTTFPVYITEMETSQSHSNVVSFCQVLSGVGSPSDRYIWDETVNSAVEDTIFRDMLKFWIGGKILSGKTELQVEPDGINHLQIDSLPGNFLITKATYPLPNLVTAGPYHIYSLQKE
jgi:hypothetical protein